MKPAVTLALGVLGACACSGRRDGALGNRTGAAPLSVAAFSRAPLPEGTTGDCPASGPEWLDAEVAIEAALAARRPRPIARRTREPTARNATLSITIEESIASKTKPISLLYVGDHSGYVVAFDADGQHWYCIDIIHKPGQTILSPRRISPQGLEALPPT